MYGCVVARLGQRHGQVGGFAPGQGETCEISKSRSSGEADAFLLPAIIKGCVYIVSASQLWPMTNANRFDNPVLCIVRIDRLTAKL